LHDAAAAVRAVRRGITLAGQRPRDLDNPGGVVNRRVHLGGVRVEALGQGGKATLDKLAVVGGQVERVEQVPAVAGVGRDRGGPAEPVQVAADRFRYLAGGGLLGVRRPDAGQPHRIDVDQEPAAAVNVVVASKVALFGHLDAVRTAGQDLG